MICKEVILILTCVVLIPDSYINRLINSYDDAIDNNNKKNAGDYYGKFNFDNLLENVDDMCNQNNNNNDDTDVDVQDGCDDYDNDAADKLGDDDDAFNYVK